MRHTRPQIRLLLAAALVACGGSATDQSTGPAPVTVASVGLTPASATLAVGDSVQLAAVARDASGSTVASATIGWSTSAAGVATVTSAGLVHAVGAGTATITASSGSVSASAALTVHAKVSGDWAIAAARFTQGVQDSAGSVPIVLGGNAAAVDVLLRATGNAGSASTQVALRLLNASGAVVYSDTVMASGVGPAPSYAKPNVQFLVPASALQAGVRWQIVRDPKGLVADDTTQDDAYPRAGPATLATVSVPDVNVRFVPVVLASNGNATGNVTAANLASYLPTARAVLPLGKINAYVGASLVSSANFGTAPTGGDASFWGAVLSDLDVARMADTAEVGTNWYGVIAPPAHFTYTSFGGFSYIPSSGTATGPTTRTSASVEVGWFSVEEHARDLVAHELSHTFGRLHAPCGGAGAPLDPAYPVPGGFIDLPGEDVYSWATGAATGAASVPTTSGDVMGYCEPVWASKYTYTGILQFRGTTSGTVAAIAPVTRVLVVRGGVTYGRSVSLRPAFAMRARPALPEAAGPYRLEGAAADGSLLFAYSLKPAALDHDPTRGQFALAIPMVGWSDTSLASLRLEGPEGSVQLSSAAVRRGLGATRPPAMQLVRGVSGSISALCAGAAGVLVLADGGRGVVSSATGASAQLPQLPAGTGLTVLCSDGVHTTTVRGAVPQ